MRSICEECRREVFEKRNARMRRSAKVKPELVLA